MPLLTTAGADREKRVTLTAAFDLGRAADPAATIFKAAVRAADCRWWVFGRKAFEGPSIRADAARERRRARRHCTTAPSWKAVEATWAADSVTLHLPLGAAVPKGRYAVRIRVQQGRQVQAERVRAAIVR